MDWKERVAFRAYTLYCKASSRLKKLLKKSPPEFRVREMRLWNMENWNNPPIDVTDILRPKKQKGKQQTLSDSLSSYLQTNMGSKLNLQIQDIDWILEVVYESLGKRRRILFREKVTFPPYTNMAPEPRYFARDFAKMEMSIVSEDDDDEEEIEAVEVDMDSVMKEMKGPKDLYHHDVEGVADWETIVRWMKRFYLNYSELKEDEKDVLMEIFWTNGTKETF